MALCVRCHPLRKIYLLTRNLNIFLLLLVLLFSAGSSFAGLRGEMEWTYLDYKADQGGETLVDANHFTQRYALHWDKRGSFYNGRGGSYKLGVGYQWLGFSSEANGEDSSASGEKITYNGDFLFAPGGLPFRINGFSYDLGVNSVDKTNVRATGDTLLESYGIVDPQLASGILGGTRIVSGLSLILGIKNGSYLGTYRELLSKYPRLLVDFHQDYIRNLDATNPEHYKVRDLAFVSLNKKKNWFHYRFRDYTNYLNSTENSYSRQFMVGTVDHLMRREWIHLTNWIKISTDLSLTLVEEGQEELESSYAFNLFEVMNRKGFLLTNFNTFERITKGENRGTEYEIPFFIRGDIDADRQYQTMLINYGETDLSFSGETEERGNYWKGQLYLGRMQQIQHVPKFSVELRRGTLGEGEAAEFEYEIFSNPVLRRASAAEWSGKYRVTWIDGDSASGGGVSALEQGTHGEILWRNVGGWDVLVSQSLLHATDKPPGDATRYISFESDYGDLKSSLGQDAGTYFQSVSKVEGSHTTTGGYRHRLKLTYEYEQIAKEKNLTLLTLGHRLDYQRRITRFSSETRLMTGDIDSFETTIDSVFSERRGNSAGSADLALLHKSSVEYSPSPSLIAKGGFAFNWARGENLDSRRYAVSESVRYLFFPKMGFRRKTAELSQDFSYTLTSDDEGDWRDLKFSLAANWYPLRMLRFGAMAAYAAMEPEGNSAVEWKLLAGVDFSKLQCELSYAYGLNRNGDDESEGDLKEHLVEARIKKIF